MSYLNTGTVRAGPEPVPTEQAPHKNTPLEEYNHNFLFPICELRSDKVIVTPFIPSLHAQAYFDGVKQDEYGVFRWVNWGPFADLSALLRFVEEGRADKTVVLFAVIDISSGQERFAGLLNLYQCSLSTLTAEVGNVLVLPPFRRTHVLTHALALFMTWCFTPPTSPSPAALLQNRPGLGLRRIQWTSSPANAASQQAATRMGFKHEGVIRNFWSWPVGKEGYAFDPTGELETADGQPRGVGHDCWLAGITKADWEAQGGVRELVTRQMARDA